MYEIGHIQNISLRKYTYNILCSFICNMNIHLHQVSHTTVFSSNETIIKE